MKRINEDKTFELAFGYIEMIQGKAKCKSCGFTFPDNWNGMGCCDNPVVSFGEPTVIRHNIKPSER